MPVGGVGGEEAELGRVFWSRTVYLPVSAPPPTAHDREGGVRVRVGARVCMGAWEDSDGEAPAPEALGIWWDTPTSSPPRTSPHYGLLEIRGQSPRVGAK